MEKHKIQYTKIGDVEHLMNANAITLDSTNLLFHVKLDDYEAETWITPQESNTLLQILNRLSPLTKERT